MVPDGDILSPEVTGTGKEMPMHGGSRDLQVAAKLL